MFKITGSVLVIIRVLPVSSATSSMVLLFRPIIRIDTIAVGMNREEYSFTHDLHTRIIRQFKVEEACICLGECLVTMLSVHSWLNHEARLSALEFLVIGWETMLAPAELDEFLLVLL